MEEFERVKSVIVDQLGADESAVTLEASFVDDLGADSLDIVELLTTLEDDLGIIITDEEVEKLHTVGEVASFIENLLQ